MPSLIRTAKIATIEARDAERLGQVDAPVWNEVARRLQEQLGLTRQPAGVYRLPSLPSW